MLANGCALPPDILMMTFPFQKYLLLRNMIEVEIDQFISSLREYVDRRDLEKMRTSGLRLLLTHACASMSIELPFPESV